MRKVQVDVIANYRPGNIPIYSKSLDTVIVSEAQNPIHIVWGSTKGTRHVCIFCFPNGYFYGQTQPVPCLYGNPPLQLCNCAQSSSLARRCEHVADPSRGTAQLSWLPLTDLVTVIWTKLLQNLTTKLREFCVKFTDNFINFSHLSPI